MRTAMKGLGKISRQNRSQFRTLRPIGPIRGLRSMPEHNVGAGRAKAVRLGESALLDSGPLTFCSTMVAKVYNNDEQVGVLMVHKGLERDIDLQRQLANEARHLAPENDLSELRVEPVAVRIPSDSPASTRLSITAKLETQRMGINVGNHDCTLQALAKEVSQTLPLTNTNEVITQATGAERHGYNRALKVRVDTNGEVNVSEGDPGLPCVLL